jgi:uncharacterized protein (UPF0303 family)
MAGCLSSECRCIANAFKKKTNDRCLAIDLSNFGTEVFFSIHALLKNRGSCVDNQNWRGRDTQINLVDWSTRCRLAWRQS